MIYSFDGFQLDIRRQTLTRAGVEISVEPQVFDLLQYLVENHDRLITKQDIIDTIWQGRAISDAAVSSRISFARQALGDNGRDQHYIKTIHNKGLRFLAHPKRIESFADTQGTASADLHSHLIGATSTAAQTQKLKRKPTVIVMPFRARLDNEMEVFTAGALVDEISSLLTVMQSVDVIPRYAAGYLLPLDVDPIAKARDLGANYAVSGNVRRENEKLRVRASLTNLADFSQLWSQKFKGKMAEIFEIEDEVTTGVIGALGGKIAHFEAMRMSRQHPKDLQAWELARQALGAAFDWQPKTLAQSVKSCQAALELDPNYALARAYLGFFLAWQVAQGWTETKDDDKKMAIYHADYALSLTAMDGEVVSAVGETYRALGNPAKAIEIYEASKLKNPDVFNSWPVSLPIMGTAYAQMGKYDQARNFVAEFDKKFPTDEMGRIWSRISLGYIELLAGNYGYAEELHHNLISEFNSMCRIVSLMMLGRVEDAIINFVDIRAVNPKVSLEHYQSYFRLFHSDKNISRKYSDALIELQNRL